MSRQIPSRIFLVGFMAVGKTTIGRLLAGKLGRPFIDLDEWIEARDGKTISEIFASDGEAHFRKIEAQILTEALAIEPAVIALGGGTFIAEENRRLIRQSGVSVFLDTPMETILGRVASTADRPLNRGEDFLKSLYEARLPSYRQADVDVRAIGSSEETVSLILESLTRDFESRG